MLRSNVTDWTPEDLWRAYIQLTEAEAAFHIHKSDLAIRPVWHQKQCRVQAHILVCFRVTCCGRPWQRVAAGRTGRRAGGESSNRYPRSRWSTWFFQPDLGRRSGRRCISQPTRASADLATAARPGTCPPRWNERRCSGNSPVSLLKAKTLFFQLLYQRTLRLARFDLHHFSRVAYGCATRK